MQQTALLPKTYDEAPGESIASIARRLRAEGKRLGNTAAAIATQIGKLVKERQKRQRRELVEARRRPMATRNEPVSARIFCHAALLEVFDGTINLNPVMFRLFKNRSDGGGVFWVC